MDTRNLYIRQSAYFQPRPEVYQSELHQSVTQKIGQYWRMSEYDRAFLGGLIAHIQPKKVLEVGVCFGGSSALILNAIKDTPGAVCHSVDIAEMVPDYYKNMLNRVQEHAGDPIAPKRIGFVVDDFYPKLTKKRKLWLGKDVSQVIEEIGGDIDFVLLDSAHLHPCETLNFLCALPFLKNGTWVAIHDLTMFASQKNPGRNFACKYLFDTVGGNKLIVDAPLVQKGNNLTRNIGAFRVDENTCRNIFSVFNNLLYPWEMEIDGPVLESIDTIIKKYYDPESYQMFKEALSAREDTNRARFQPPKKLKI